MNPRRLDHLHKLQALRRDVHFLGELLGRVLVHQEGQALFDTVERIRRLAIRVRRLRRPADERAFLALLRRLDAPTTIKVIRAFSVYFQLVNIAEEVHRLRRKRYYESLPGFHPQRGSIEDLVRRLRAAGVAFPALARQIDEQVTHKKLPDEATVLEYETAVRELEVSITGQSYVVARANYEKLMARVNQQMSLGIERGATSNIITLA